MYKYMYNLNVIFSLSSQVLYSLDENYTDDAMLLLRVPQILLRQMCVWYPITCKSTDIAEQHSGAAEQPDSRAG